MYAATEGRYTLMLVNDPEPLNPRRDCDNFGHMVCWHQRYDLGDRHDHRTPEDFLRDLYRRSIDNGGKQLVCFLKEKKARGAFLQYNRRTHEWDLYEYCYWRTALGNSKPEWEVYNSAPKSQLNDKGWFFEEMLNALTIDDLKELLSERRDMVILPLYLYDHSVQSMSTGSFVGRTQHAEWDSGQVGYIYAGRDDILKTYGDINCKSVQKAEAALEAEVKCYDMYLRGECYGFRLYEDGEETDSCWGFPGDLDAIRESVREYLPAACSGLVDKLEYTWEAENDYLQNCAAA